MALGDAPEVSLQDGHFPINFKVPRQGVRRKFTNIEEVAQFLTQEVAFWQDFQQQSAKAPTWQTSGVAYFRALGLERAKQAQQAVAGNATPQSARDALWQLVNNRTILSESRDGQALKDLVLRVPEGVPALAFALRASQSGNVEQVEPRGATLRDVSSMAAALLGFNEAQRRSIPDRAVLKRLVEQAGDLLQAQLDEKAVFATWRDEVVNAEGARVEAAEAQRAQEFDAMQDELAALRDELRELRASTQGQLTELQSVITRDVEDFKKRVRQDVIDEVPTTFWNKKANWHFGTAIVSGVVFALVILIGIWWVDTHAIDLLANAYARIVGDRPDSALITLVPLALLTIPALGFAWVLRHISRVIVQNLSLGADARLRGTITSTYRSLAEDKSMSPAELALVLQALFRPIDGKDHTEIAPPSISELLKLNDKGD